MGHDIAAATITAVGSVVAAALSGLVLRASRKTRGAVREVKRTLEKVEERTSTELDQRIEEAVKRTLRDSPEAVTSAIIAEAVRDLLEGIIEAAGRDDHG